MPKRELLLKTKGTGAVFLSYAFIKLLQAQQPFHQQADHYLKARLEPEAKKVVVYDSLVYVNKSPHSLDTFYLHLWPQAYTGGRTALARQKAEQGNTDLIYRKSKRGRMTFRRFEQNGRPVAYRLWKNNPDVVWWRLEPPLKPGETLILVFQYDLYMPSASISRMGVKEDDYFVTQWFPKPAVYDADGWHPMPYLDQGEFYCEWGTYKVALDVPARYVVAASGIPDPDYLRLLEQWADNPNAPRDTTGRRIQHFVAERVHDFAWCASPSWVVERLVYPDPVSGAEKTVFAYYKPENSGVWKGITQQGRQTLSYFASYFGKDYPYAFYNIVDGSIAAGGGMEYPQLTIIGPAGDRGTLEEVVHHEIGHMWFQGILASNERDHPWLDEGLNSYFDRRYKRDIKGEEEPSLAINFSPGRLRLGNLEKGKNLIDYFLWSALVHIGAFQAPARYASAEFTQANYGLSVYQHTAYLFYYLEEVLGREVLDSAMRLFYSRHAFTHVRPDDLRKAFEDVAQEDMYWFFGHLIRNNGAEDYRFRRKDLRWNKNENRLSVTLRFRRIPMPVPLYVGPEYMKDGAKYILKPGQDGLARLFSDSLLFKPHNLSIGRPFTLPDFNFRNNNYTLKGEAWRRKGGFSVFPLINLTLLLRNGFALWPVYGWNNNNKSMLGLLLHNYSLPAPRIQYYWMPLFSFNPHSLAGSAGMEVRFFSRRNFRPFVLSLDVHRYAYNYTTRPFNYLKTSLGLSIPLIDPRRPWRALMEVRTEYFCVEWEQHLWQPQADLNDRNRYFRTLAAWHLEKNTRWNPFRHSLFVESISEHSHRSSFNQSGKALRIYQEIKGSVFFIPKYRGMHVRFFQGGFPKVPDTRVNVNYKLSSWPGFYDYTYSGVFWDRSATRGFLSRQMMEADGGFHQFVNFQSWRYLAAINLRLDLPSPLPVRVFGDFGYSSTAYPLSANGFTHFFWSAGFTLHILDEALAVHFPIIFSKAIRYNLELNGLAGLDRQIRFVVDFQRLNPRRLYRWFRFLN
jgi:hypothetical protein